MKSGSRRLADLQSFADSLDLDSLAPATRYRSLSAVKSLLAFGHRIGYLPFDVGRALRLPAVRSRLAERILREANIHRMLSLDPNERNRALLLLLCASGAKSAGFAGGMCRPTATASRSPSSAREARPAPYNCRPRSPLFWRNCAAQRLVLRTILS